MLRLTRVNYNRQGAFSSNEYIYYSFHPTLHQHQSLLLTRIMKS